MLIVASKLVKFDARHFFNVPNISAGSQERFIKTQLNLKTAVTCIEHYFELENCFCIDVVLFSFRTWKIAFVSILLFS